MWPPQSRIACGSLPCECSLQKAFRTNLTQPLLNLGFRHA